MDVITDQDLSVVDGGQRRTPAQVSLAGNWSVRVVLFHRADVLQLCS